MWPQSPGTCHLRSHSFLACGSRASVIQFLKWTVESSKSGLAGGIQTSWWPVASPFKEEAREGDREQGLAPYGRELLNTRKVPGDCRFHRVLECWSRKPSQNGAPRGPRAGNRASENAANVIPVALGSMTGSVTESQLQLLQKPRGRWAPALIKAGPGWAGSSSREETPAAGRCGGWRLLRAITRVTFYFKGEETLSPKCFLQVEVSCRPMK